MKRSFHEISVIHMSSLPDYSVFFSVFDAPSSPKKGPNPGMVCEIRRESFRRLLEELGKVRLGEFEDLGFGPAGFRV